ncbi:MAG: 16S rRNA (guanine(966)-N(2))-methyltransferase RsmD, partial [Pseudomonadota bacterium]
DRVREAVFNILEHGIEDLVLHGVRVLDLFAGTGALGIEALSRGALTCLFVDNDARARAVIRKNIETFGLGGTTRVLRSDATNLGFSTNRNTFSLVFVDPPYGQGLAERALNSARDYGWLETGAIIVVEEAATAQLAWPDGFSERTQRTYGATQIAIGQFNG